MTSNQERAILQEPMDFVTLHQLARELNIPEKNLRYLFRKLRRAQKITEGDDFIKENYQDDRHFTYKINPVTFLKEAGLSPAPPSGDTNGYHIDTKTGNKPEDIVTEGDIKSPEPALNQDLLDVLTQQLRVKDGQLEKSFEQNERQQNQIDSLQKINNMAMGEIIKLNQQLRLSSSIQTGTNGYQNGNQYDTKEEYFGNESANGDYQSDTEFDTKISPGSVEGDSSNYEQDPTDDT